MNRIGGVLCPYVNMLSDFWTPLPLIIYGGLATAGGLLALLLPETLGTGGCSYTCRLCYAVKKVIDFPVPSRDVTD